MSKSGQTRQSSREKVELALSRIQDPAGQGASTFTRVYAESARAAGEAADQRDRHGVEQAPLGGWIVSLKDLFDVAGETTLAGSVALREAPPARHDAPVVRRLRQAGAAIIGKTNMTEFAFSGLGLNPHYGTPLNAWDRANARIPGGSSSGAAISVTDGMADIAIGTDTGGSCRIPAALNGIVGFKPTARTVPLDGMVPLSASYDSVGPLAASVEACARAYAVLSQTPDGGSLRDPAQLRLGVVRNYVLEDMDEAVSAAYDNALSRLSQAGVALQHIALPVLEELPSLFVEGGIVGAEAYAWHRLGLESAAEKYDPRVSVRIRRAAAMPAYRYIQLQQLRHRLIAEWTAQIGGFDAVLMPTVPLVAPPLQALAEDEAYGAVNLLMLRNPTLVNALDGCAISLPCHRPGEAPVGLSLACAHGRDWQLIGLARTLEPLLKTF